MADEENNILTGNGGNLKPLKKAIREGIKELTKLKTDRKAVNASMGAVREQLNASGIPKVSLSMGMKYLEMTQEEREASDIAFEIVREVVTESFEPTLFDD